MATVKLYNVKESKLVDYEVISENGEIIATHKDSFIKFPGGLTAKQFKKLVDEHNKVNADQVPISEKELKEQEDIEAKNLALLKSLE